MESSTFSIEYLASIQAISIALNLTQTAEAVADTFISHVLPVLGASAGVFSMLSDDATKLHNVRIQGFPESVAVAWECIPLDSNLPLPIAIRTNKTVFYESNEEFCRDYPQFKSIHEKRGALVALPMYHREQPIGGIGLVFETDRKFTTPDRSYLETVVLLCAQALHRSQLLMSERENHERFHAFMNNASFLAWITSVEGKIHYLNAAYASSYGLDLDAVVGMAATDLFSPEQVAEFIENNRKVAATGQVLEVVETVTKPDGTEAHYLVHKFPLSKHRMNSTDEEILIGGIAVDVTERRWYAQQLITQMDELHETKRHLEQKHLELQQAHAELEQANSYLEALATTDGLTGLFNHRAFQESLSEQFHRAIRYELSLSVIMMDLDDFKHYNDAFGHIAGDRVLKRVADILIQTAPTSSTVARYGGEEFVILLPGMNTEQATKVAENYRRLIENNGWLKRKVTASFGVATLVKTIISPTELIAAADQALYRSKKLGRNCVTVSTSDKEEITLRETPDRPYTEWMQGVMTAQHESLASASEQIRIALIQAYDSTVESWSSILDLRDKETEGHSERVTDLTVRLARCVGMNEEEVLYARWGALLHDIGKMGVPDKILLKPGPLTEEEWTIMRRHPRIAYDMLSPITFMRPALDIPYCHHEKWDGSGYPRGLNGEEIPLSARLFAVVDVYDALRSDRPYRRGWPERKVVDYLQAQSGTHFDPGAVLAFLRMKLRMKHEEAMLHSKLFERV